MGTVYRNNRRLSFGVEKVIINNCYVERGIGFDDMGLVKTDRDMNVLRLNDTFVVNIVCLPKIESKPIGLKVVLSGWDRTHEDIESLTQTLQIAVKRLVSIHKRQIDLFFRSVGLQIASNDNLCVQNSDSTACSVSSFSYFDY